MYDTKITKDTDCCAKALISGEVVAFATETVYGLGADCFNEQAVRKIFEAKGRPADNPLIVHVSSIQQAKTLVNEWTKQADMLANRFWPGPLSLVMEKAQSVPMVTSGGRNTIAVRMPGKSITQEFLQKCGCPVAAPSANTSTRPSPTSARHVLHDMDGKIPYILDGGECSKGIESTVLDVENKIILRPGSVTKEDLEEIIGEVGFGSGQDALKSPGTKYPHYCPSYKVVLVKGKSIENKIKELYNLADSQNQQCLVVDIDGILSGDYNHFINYSGDVERCAAELYKLLIDGEGKIDVMLVAGTAYKGVGIALTNRLEKASAGNIVVS